jgi:hypothetical protein
MFVPVFANAYQYYVTPFRFPAIGIVNVLLVNQPDRVAFDVDGPVPPNMALPASLPVPPALYISALPVLALYHIPTG